VAPFFQLRADRHRSYEQPLLYKDLGGSAFLWAVILGSIVVSFLGFMPSPLMATPEHAQCSNCHQADHKPSSISVRPDVEAACQQCHKTHDFEHALSLQNRKDLNIEIPKAWPAPQIDKPSCTTCHENEHCEGKAATGPGDLRGGPYKVKGYFCQNCHQGLGNFLETFNPHVLSEGNSQGACSQCHKLKLGEVPVKGQPNLKEIPEFLCENCHKTDIHALSAIHVGKIMESPQPAESPTVANQKTVETRSSASPALPLGTKRQIICLTCHDPHIKDHDQLLEYQIKKALAKTRKDPPRSASQTTSLSPTIRDRNQLNQLCLNCHKF
jgi:hypothetical protein